MKIIMVVFLLALLASCNKKEFDTVKYYSLEAPAVSVQRVARYIDINKSYDFYVRQVYKGRNEGGGRVLTTERALLSADNRMISTDTLIETEYLLVSGKRKNIIYISTAPDKYQTRYQQTYLGDQVINIYHFRKFCFGKIEDDGTFLFMKKESGSSDRWNVNFAEKDSISVNTVEEIVKKEFTELIPVKHALAHQVSFKYVNAFQIIFYDRKLNIPVADNRIYFQNATQPYDLYFRMSGDNADIHFNDQRVKYTPDRLLEDE